MAKAHKDGRLGVLKGLLGGEGCPWEVGGCSWCSALWRRSTAARPAATGATGAPASSTSTASSSGASLKSATRWFKFHFASCNKADRVTHRSRLPCSGQWCLGSNSPLKRFSGKNGNLGIPVRRTGKKTKTFPQNTRAAFSVK